MKLDTTELVLLVVLIATFVLNGDQVRKTQKELTLSTSQNNDCGLQFIVNSTSNLVAILNETAARAVVFDINYGYTATFCGSTSNVILIDLKSKNGLFITGNFSRSGWAAQSQSFKKIFNTLASLQSIFTCNEKTGVKFIPDDASSDVTLEIKLVLIALSNKEYYVTQAHALEDFMYLTGAFVQSLRGPLNGVSKILESGIRPMSISDVVVIVLFDIFGKIFSKVKGGVSVLAEINLDWNSVLHTRSWQTIFYTLFSKLKKHNVDVKSILADYNQNLASLGTAFAGNYTHGINGVIRIIAECRAIIMGKPSADFLVKVLLEYYTQCGNCGATYEDFLKEILPLVDFFKEIEVTEVLPVAIYDIHRFQKRNYVENGIDMYKITSISLEESRVPLQSIVEILNQVQNRTTIYTTIGVLLNHLISMVEDRSVSEIRSLVPSIKIDSFGDFSRGANVSDLQRNFYESLHCHPVIGQLLDVIDSGLKTCDGKSLREIIESASFCKYQCVITKTLKTQGTKNGLGTDRHHGVSRKHFAVGHKQITRGKKEKYHERHNEYEKQHKERSS